MAGRATSPAPQTVLIQGATGNTGFATINALLNHPHPFSIRAGVHDLSKADKLSTLGPQVEVVQLDTEYPQTVRKALQGVNKIMLCPPNTEDRVEASKLLIQAAVDAGVSHIVLISILCAEARAVSFQKQFASIEQFLERCGVGYTILRCPFFMEDFYFLAPQLLRGQLQVPLGAGSTVMMSTKDVGECAAAVLASRETVHYGKRYNLTGPEMLDGNKMAAALSDGLGTPIMYNNISSTDAKDMFLSVGFEPSQAAGFVEVFQLLSLGGGAFVSQESAALLGRQPISLNVWARDNFAALSDRARAPQFNQYQPSMGLESKLPNDAMYVVTNEQGQQTVNQQGQQGAVYYPTSSTLKLSSSIPVYTTQETSQPIVTPVASYQKGAFPHLVGHSDAWNSTYYPMHQERRTRQEYERNIGYGNGTM